MGSWWTQGDPRTPWGLGCLKTPRSWWTQGDPGAPGVWECPRTPGPGAAFLQDCQPCCVEAQPRPPWGPWPRPPWGPWVVSALGPGLWLRHRPSWPQPQDMCPAGPPGQSAWQRCADMPPLPSLQGALLASVLGSSRRRPTTRTSSCSLRSLQSPQSPSLYTAFGGFVLCSFYLHVQSFCHETKTSSVPFGLREQPRGAGESSAITSAALACGVSVDSPVHPGVDVTYKGCVSRFCEAGVVCLWAAWWRGRPSQCPCRHTI